MNSIKGFFAGSGADAFSDASVVDRLLRLVRPTGPRVRVAYIGTATYDLPAPMQAQTELLAARGCEVRPILVANPTATAVTAEEAEFVAHTADVILVSGGNTLYAVRRWKETALDTHIRTAAARQAVLAGGSAGAICWFTAGHSDSADPNTYAKAMLESAVAEARGEGKKSAPDGGAEDAWFYIRVAGLDLLPGMICPHYDKVQSNGVLREVDFKRMMKRHPSERGIAIDHWAALILNGDGTYEVFHAAGKERAAHDASAEAAAAASAAPSPDTSYAKSSQPAAYTLDVVNGVLTEKLIPASGAVADILRAPTGPTVADPFERYFAMANPSAASGRLVQPGSG